ncbi:FkbM family methyltransferase [Terrarubrum flagellatum]|uniref:FkbM family methyltransferase n=1 Tax=Terrirubrum flagellatum TaxID=2895980 RepID=UPI003144D864
MLELAVKSAARTALRRFAPQVLVHRHMRRFGRDEIEAFVLDLIVPSGHEAIDVGANWGVYARKLAPLCDRVHCFEPNPELAAILQRTLPSNCIVEQAAASDKSGESTLFLPLDASRVVDGLASLNPPPGMNLAAIPVRTKSLDAFIDRPIGFIKIDVEGAEMAVLAGARELVARHAPVILIEIEERHRQGAIAEARRWFESRGYQGWFIDQDQFRPIHEFSPAMQDWSAFDSQAPRRSQRYVNNFLFAPAGFVTAGMRDAIHDRLAMLHDDE